ncbi:MAG: hypothetical protein AW10_03199 [Candidatus Accumulibacter appositus]|uniref:Integrase SAM-like N-terminal domain-containing protein n=1 Tax=Candidatus Accumulibacter appositus TaxID=1454003 RepID=A0A011QHB7_9PROT|nr:hypothetical protein [Accumulibacter sp.]EXI78229.1 MAG: hypothetical protein AW10_03199 [Candidatus Accumulibacter appositus]HRF06596.1 hypothetical protein [Accumulibacter sp.]
MTPLTQNVTPLRQRMIDDMRIRQLTDKTTNGHVRAVRRFAGFLGRSPDTATNECDSRGLGKKIKLTISIAYTVIDGE